MINDLSLTPTTKQVSTPLALHMDQAHTHGMVITTAEGRPISLPSAFEPPKHETLTRDGANGMFCAPSESGLSVGQHIQVRISLASVAI